MERDSGYALCLPCPPSPPLEPSGFSQGKAFSPRQWSMTVCHHTAAGMIATNLWEKDEVRLRGGKTTERSGEAGLVPRLLSQRKGEQGLWHIILAPKDTPEHQPCIWPGGSNPETRWPRSQRPHLWVSISQEHVALEGQFPHHTHCTLLCAGPRPDWASISTLPQLSCDCASTPLTVGRGTHTHTHTHTRSHSGSWRHLGTSFRESLCTVWARLDSRLQNVEPSKGNEP